jgi:hypothetical protein
MKVTMLLADAAQAVGGKLFILGGGWSVTNPSTSPSALAIKVEVPWHEANRRHELVISLLDADGRPVMAPAQPPATEEQPLEIRGQIEVGRPAGLPEGTPLDSVLAVTIGPLQLQPGGRYVWRLSINGESHEDWQAAFITRRLPQPLQP